MIITIRLFAILRDRAGTAETTVDLATGATAADACRRLVQTFPSLALLVSKIAFAINQQYVPSTTELHDGDELALIPPVSGG